MNSEEIRKKFELERKFKEYQMKIIKMAGYLSDYFIDRALESDDFSIISSLLISYFSGPAGHPFDIGYLISKYKEYGLDKVEDIDFDINEWYKMKYEIDINSSIKEDIYEITKEMTEEEYIQYMIEQRKKESEK
jgi:hypothetical protein